MWGFCHSFWSRIPGPLFFPSLMTTIDSPAWRTWLVVHWLRLHASHGRATHSIPGQGTKIAYAVVKFIYIYKDSSSWIFPSRLQVMYFQLTAAASTLFVYWKDLSKTMTALKTLLGHCCLKKNIAGVCSLLGTHLLSAFSTSL